MLNGNAEAIVQDADAYQSLPDIASRAVFEAIRQGLEDPARGHTRAARELFEDIRRGYGIPR